MRIDRPSLAAFGLILLALTGCSSSPRQADPAVGASAERHTRGTQSESPRSGTDVDPNAGAARYAGGAQGDTSRGGAKTERDIAADAARHALAMRGKPYRYGGYTPKGFDCSGLVHYSYAKSGGHLPRNTNGLWVRSRTVARSEMRPGDLLFFHQEGKSNSHVGLYVGNNRFVHAPSSGKRVSTASLSDPYWRRHFSAARRPVV